MGPMFIASLAICFLALLYKYLKDREWANNISKHFPTPPRSRLLGVTIFSETGDYNPIDIFKTVMSFNRKYGKNVIIHGPLNHIELLVSRPEDIEMIMTSKNTKKSFSYEFVKPWLGEGLLISFGTKWFNRRKIITPTFHFKILEQFVDVFNEQDKILIKKLEKHVDKEDCNMYEYLTTAALDSICETAMGVKIHAQDNPNTPYIKAVKEMSEIIFNRVFSLLAIYPKIWELTRDARRSKEVEKILHDFTDGVINDRRKQLEVKGVTIEDDTFGRKQRYSFLDMLLQAKIDGEPLTNLDVREEVDTFMFEGHDTTTSGMTFAVYHLAMNQDVQQKAFEELKTLMGNDPSTPCTYNILQEMKYMEKVIKETLRMHPSVPLIGRTTLEPVKIEGVTIPENIDITIPIYAIHHNAEIFPDPERFDPERFDEEKERSWGPFDYIPFSAGNRNCVGQRYAMLEMKAMVSSILRNYKILPTDRTKHLTFRTDLVLRPVNGLYLRLEKRTYE